MRTSIIAYRLFDVADEINLDNVQALWHSRNKISSRLRLDRISTKSITFHDPPVLVELGFHEMQIAGHEYLVEVKARIQDLGVICILFNIPQEEELSYQEFLDLVLAVEDLPDEEFRRFLDATMETIGPACTNQNISGYDEDFVVYYFQDPIPQDWDIVPFLLKDPNPVNEETRAAALANRFSYADDVAYLTWDSAVVYDPTGSMDIPDLLEFANAQYLELRYYDNFLNHAIDKTYNVIDDKANLKNMEVLRNIRDELLETMADVSSLTSNISNALLVTEDIFYAKVYSRYLELLKGNVWQENIELKMRVLQRCYNMLNETVTSHHMEQMRKYNITLLAIIAVILLGIAIFK
ncbi:MAG: hypothetical protein IJ657_04860 [Acidaminococcaceae bacterium]|nr:hypothetical protein [Acidaminococcaceae bacterium]MBR1590384.1 hypothetical protein [Acidaminococcaceae bacterium]